MCVCTDIIYVMCLTRLELIIKSTSLYTNTKLQRKNELSRLKFTLN